MVKLLKLLFYADFLHFEKYGRPILGDTYFRLPGGPAPTESYDLYKDNFQKEQKADLKKYFAVINEKVGGYQMQRINPLKEYDPNVFSESDIEIMSQVAKKFYNVSGTELAGETHKIPFVKEASHMLELDYENILEESSDKEYVQFIKKMEKEVVDSLKS